MADIEKSIYEDNVLKISDTTGAAVANTATLSYGALKVTAAGLWTYTPSAAIQSLAFGSSVADTVTLNGKSYQFLIFGTNDDAKIAGVRTATITDGTIPTGAVLVGGTIYSISGLLTVVDADAGQSKFKGLLSSGTIVTTLAKTYGTFDFNPDTKIWKYTYDSDAIKLLGGKELPVETVTVVTVDGSTSTISVTIKGTNAIAAITGDTTATLTEDLNVTDGSTSTNIVSMNAGVVDIATAGVPKSGFLHAKGLLVSTGADSTDDKFTAGITSKTYGTFAIDEGGNWTYDAANNSSALQALTEGSTKIETIVVKSKDGLSSTTVSITLVGKTNSTIGSFGTATESNAKDTAISGSITVMDNGSAPALADRPSDVTSGIGKYGTYTYTKATNKWTYLLDSTKQTIDELKTGESLTDTIKLGDGTVTVINTAGNLALTGAATVDGVVLATGDRILVVAQTTNSEDGIYTVSTTGAWTRVATEGAVANLLSKSYVVMKGSTNAGKAFDLTTDGSSGLTATAGAGDATITVLIKGADDLAHFTNDAASIYGAQSGTIAETNNLTVDGVVAVLATSNIAITGAVTVDGVVLITGDRVLAVGQTDATQDGIYVVDTTGAWTLAADSTNLTVLTNKNYFVQHGTANIGKTVTLTGTVGTALSHVDASLAPGVLVVSGTLDAIFDYTTATVAQRTNTTEFTAAVTSKTNGVFTVGVDGTWKYEALANGTAFQKLAAGSSLTEAFVVKTADGKASTTVTVSLTGSDTASEGALGTVTESNSAATTTVSGVLSVLDTGVALIAANRPADLASNATGAAVSGAGASGSYGVFSYSSGTNKWTYVLTNSLVTQLGDGDTLTDTLALSTGEKVTVVIKGVNDVSTITSSEVVGTGDTTFTNVAPVTSAIVVDLTEDTNLTTVGGNLKAHGKLNVTDVDTGEALFIAQTVSDSTGVFTLGTDGDWTYIADNEASAVQKLTSATTSLVTKVFTAKTEDGSSKTITVKIHGLSNNTYDYAAVTLDADITTTVTGTLKNLDGTLVVTAGAYSATATPHGKLIMSDKGVFVYHLDPTAGYTFVDGATETIAVTVAGGTTDIKITLTKSDQAPLISGTVSTDTLAPLTLEADGSTAAITGDLNFTDPDATGAAPAFDTTAFTSPTYGAVTLLSNGNWSYQVTDNNATLKALTSGQSLTDTFVMQVTDADGAEGSATVSVVIRGKTDAPVGVADTGAAIEDSPTITSSVSVLANDTDIDAGQTATLKVSGAHYGSNADTAVSTAGTKITGNYGSITLKANGTYTYVADLPASDLLATDATGNDVFTYTVMDTDGVTSTSTITITVTGKEDGSAVQATAGDDNIVATSNDETIDGLAGDDYIDGAAGSDTLTGGLGNDTLIGGSGDDVIAGSAGFDTITGGSGDDTVDGGADGDTISDVSGTNTLKGGAGVDTITGGSGVDTIEGGTEDDFIDGGADADSLKGDAGNDTILYGSGDTLVDGGVGTDVLRIIGTNAGVDLTSVFVNIERVEGKSATPGDAESALLNDQTILVNSTALTVVKYIDLGAGTDQVTVTGVTSFSDVTLVGVETIQGQSTADTITGTANADSIKGGAGDDIINGGSGTDTLLGEAGDDTFIWSGNDTYTGGETVEVSGDILKASGTVDISGATITEIEKLQGANTLIDTVTIKGNEGFTTIDLGTATGTATDTLIFNANTLDLTGVTLAGVETIKSDISVTITDTVTINTATVLDTLATLNLGAGADVLIISGTVSLAAVTLTGVETLNGDGAAANQKVTLTVNTDNSSLGSLTTIDLGTGTTDELVVQGSIALSGATINNVEKLSGSTASDTITLTNITGFDTINTSGVTPDGYVKTVSTANTALTGLLTINGYTLLDGDRILVKDQTDATQDGIYVAHAGAWALDTDSLAAAVLTNKVYVVQKGNDQGDALTLTGTVGTSLSSAGSAATDTDTLIVNDGIVTFASILLTGVDIIKGAGTTQVITGSTGDDTFEITSGVTLHGGGGTDTVKGTTSSEYFYLGKLFDVDVIDALDNGTHSDIDIMIVGSASSLTGISISNFEKIEGTGLVDNFSLDATSLASIISGGITAIDLKADTDSLIVVGTSAFDLSAMTLTSVESIEGDAAANTITGTAGEDVINGNVGNDILLGGLSADTLNGGAGDDTFTWDTTGDTYIGGSGSETAGDILNGTAAADTIVLSQISTVEKIDGLGDTDILSVSGTQTIAGIVVDNIESIVGSTGTDSLTIGTIADLNEATTINLGSGTDVLNVSGTISLATLTLTSVDSIQLAAAGVTITGSSGVDNIVGGIGADTFIVTGTNTDTMNGTSGADTVSVSGASVVISGATITNVDSLVASDAIDNSVQIDGTDLVAGNFTTIDLGAGTADTVVVVGNADFTTVTTWTGVEYITGNGSTQTITGKDARAETFIATAGATIIGGSGGGDTVVGTSGNNDSINLALISGVETIDGISGTGDTLLISGTATLASITLANMDAITGTTGDDTLTLGTIAGLGGITTIDLLGGNDTLAVTGTIDLSTLTLTSVETIQLAAAGVTITGTSGADNIVGGIGNDTIIYHSLDTINGTSGTDTIQGSIGVDTYKINKISNIDTIDAVSGIDAMTYSGTADMSAITLTNFAATLAIDGENSTNNLTVDTDKFTSFTLVTITGGTGADTVTFGGDQSNTLAKVQLTAVETVAGTTLSDVLTISDVSHLGTAAINLGAGAADELIVSGTMDLSAVTITLTEKLTGGTADETVTIDNDHVSATNFTTIDLVSGADTLVVSGAGAVDLSTATISNVDLIKFGNSVTTVVGTAAVQTYEWNSNLTSIAGGVGVTDVLKGSTGNDTFALHKISGIETINGNGGTDALSYSGTVDMSALTLTGFDTTLVITGVAGTDALTIDTSDFAAFTGGVTINGVSGTDSVGFATTANFSLFTLSNIDTVTGSGGNDVLTLGAGVLGGAAINLGAGSADELVVSGTIDLSSSSISLVEELTGDTTDDTVTIDNDNVSATSFTTIDLVSGADTLIVSGAGAVDLSTATISNVDLIKFGNSVTTVVGTTAAQTYEWNSNLTSITGGAGGDILKGSTGNDTFALNKISGIETINGNGGTDALSYSGTVDMSGITLSGFDHSLVITGVALQNDALTIDTTKFASFDGGVTINGVSGTDSVAFATAANFALVTLSNIDSVTGSSGNDVLTLGTVANLNGAAIALGAGTADDLVVSGTMDISALTITLTEKLTGGTANEIVTIDNDHVSASNFTTIDLVSGTDTLIFENAGAVVLTTATISNVDLIKFGNSITTVVGTTAGQTYEWNANITSLTGGAGSDTLQGSTGVDTFALNKLSSIETINSNGGTDVMTYSGTVDISGVTLSNFGSSLSITGAASNDALTIDTSKFTAFTTVTIDGGADVSGDRDSLKIAGAFDLGGKFSVSNVETLLGTAASADTVTLRVVGADSVLDGITKIDLGTGADALVVRGALDMSGVTTSGVETLTGSASDDTITIVGTEGFTTINLAAGGDTLIVTGATVTFAAATLTGIETIKGDGTAQSITGSAGNDTFELTAGLTTLSGGSAGTDTVNGTSAADTFNMSVITNMDVLDGKGNTDIVLVSGTLDLSAVTLTSIETLNGTAVSNEVVTLTAAQVAGFTTINLNTGSADKIVASGVGTFNLAAATGVELIDGDVSAQTIFGLLATGTTIDGKGGSDTIKGGDGADSITFYAGDSIDGGNGSDTLNVSGTANLGAATVTNIELVQGSSSADFITGTSNNDTIQGGEGDDTINGGNGTDSLLGQGGDDTFISSTGGDTYNGGLGTDRLIVTAASTNLVAATLTSVEVISSYDIGATNLNVADADGADQTLIVSSGSVASLTLIDLGTDTGAGTKDTLVASGTVDLSPITLTGIENLKGTSGDDTITVTGANIDTLETIDMVSGTDVLQVSGTVDLSQAGLTVTNVDTIQGLASADTITGTTGVDVINGGNGNDIIVVTAGADTYNGQADYDTLQLAAAGGTTDLSTGYVSITLFEKLSGSAAADVVTILGTEGFTTIDLGGNVGDNLKFSTTLDLSAVTLLNTEIITGLTANADTLTLTVVNGNSTLGSVLTIDLVGAADADILKVQGVADLTGATITNTEALDGLAGNADVITVDRGQITATNFTTIDLKTGTDTLIVSGTGAATFAAATVTGVELIRFGDSITTIAAAATSQTYEWNANITSITGAAGTDTLQGTAAADTFTMSKILTFTAGSDVINGIGGNDTVALVTGDDVSTITLTSIEAITSSGGTVTLDLKKDGGGNTDLGSITSISLAGAGDTMEVDKTVDFSNVTISGIEALHGDAGTAEIITFKNLSGTMAIDLLAGADSVTLKGTSVLTSVTFAGVETIQGSSGADNITMSDTTLGQQLDSGASDDIVTGGTGVDDIAGGAGADLIHGGANDDTIDGGSDTDHDSLFGDAGDDILIFHSLAALDSFSGGANTGAGDTLQFAAAYSGNLSAIDFTGIEVLDLTTNNVLDALTINPNLLEGNLTINADLGSDTVIIDGVTYDGNLNGTAPDGASPTFVTLDNYTISLFFA